MAGIEGLKWLGHASFHLKMGGKVIYFDPWKIASGEKADLILITHSHFDHFSVEDVKKVATEQTAIIATPDCKGLPGSLKFVKPGDILTVGDVTVEAVPAYNLNKDFHPKKNQWVGYVVTVGGKRIYHAGDTDAIPEMNGLKNIDIALLPVSGVYVMTAEEAAKAANTFHPATVVPMHWGDIVGNRKDAERFASLFSGSTVIL